MSDPILTSNIQASTDRAVERAQKYIDAGLAVVPLSPEDKRPIHVDWPARAAAREFTAADFEGCNVGVVLGHVSQHLTDIDLDSQAAIALAPYFLPPTLTFGRASKPRSHWLYYCEGVRSQKLRFTVDDEQELVEVRSTNAASDECGHQTAFPGSMHPSGERVEFTDEAIEPSKIDPGDLLWRVCRLTVASIIAQNYTEGRSRNAQTLGLAGGLLKAGWTTDEVAELFDAVRAVSGDDREKDRSAVERTIDTFEQGGEVTGFGSLIEDGVLPEQTLAEIQKHCRTPETRKRDSALARTRMGSSLRDRAVADARATDGMVSEQVIAVETPAAAAATPAEVDDTADAQGEGYDPAVDYVIEHLARPSVGVYQRSGKLAIVTREACDAGEIVRPAGSPTIRDLVLPRLKEIIRTTSGPSHATYATDVMARGEWAHIRPLDAIVSFPVMRRDGSLLLTSGYDAPTRTLAEMAIRVSVRDKPTQVDAQAAVASLADLVSDFPFVGNAHRSAWLASLLTPLARPAIDGPTPMLLLDASQRGSGKTLLADVIATIVAGAAAPRRTAPETAEEWRKVIFAMLRAGDPLVLIDNVTRMLSSAALDAILTGTTYQDRLLGVSEEQRVAVRATLMASTNNAKVSTDLVRRTLLCRLEPEAESPETRTGFKVPDLLGHTQRERARYLADALTILRAYAAAGRPKVPSRPMGSYTAWCRVVRDALVWAGAADPAETQDLLRESGDVERDELRDLLTAWDAFLGDRALSVRELLDAARTGHAAGGSTGERVASARAGAPLLDALQGIMPGGAEPAAHAIGNRLRSLRGQITGGLVLKPAASTRTNTATWRVVRVG